tara:strand:+ start:5361 stop:7163 length:1803 start_codon:yes stop_codon:yes gene_type:complete
MIKLIDYVKVMPDPSLYKLSKKEKIELIDSSINPIKNGLIITYDLSHSARRINNRIYSVKGQQNGIKSLLTPYAKPILQHHDIGKDPIGRFVGGKWEDLSNEAIRFFDNLGAFMKFKQEMNSDDPERMYKALKKHNLLTNKNWPGLGRMRATAKITDKEAVEKFLDGRYITFSAGSTTDRHVCSICNCDWAKGDFCEHRHGKIYDNETCVFFTGDFKVLEGSVVNTPADDLSQIQSMELLSDSFNDLPTLGGIELDDSYIFLSDSTLNYNIPNEEVSMEKDETSATEEVSETTTEPEGEVVVEDEVKSETEEIELSDKVMEKIFDYIKNKMKEDDNAKKEKEEAQSENSGEVLEAKDSQVDEKQELEGSDGAKVSGVQSDVQDEKENKEQVGDFDGDINALMTDSTFDWYLLDSALGFELGDKALTTEQRKELPDSAFCGPDRSFPVNDCAHVTAARRLIGRAKLSDSQKAKVLACVDRKAKDMSCDKTAEDKLDDLALRLEAEIKDLKEKLSNLSDSKEEVVVEQKKELKIVENPSVGTSDQSSPTDNNNIKQLGSYEQKIIKDYSKILNDQGEIAAESFFNRKSRYLAKGFHPKKYIN